MNGKKAFTLMELLVVVIIVAVVVMLLPLFQHRGHELPKRVQCATQLNGIGKSMIMYANENRDAFPVVYGSDPELNAFGQGRYYTDELDDAWWCDTQKECWDNEFGTIGGSLYLLVRYTDLTPKMFVCPSSDNSPMGSDALVFAIANHPEVQGFDDLWDFPSMNNLSFSYNNPWVYPIDASSDSSLVVMADKNPAYDMVDGSFNKSAGICPVPNSDGSWGSGVPAARDGMSLNHKGEMQNVLYADTHVKKHTEPTVGVEDDNIYTRWYLDAVDDYNRRLIGLFAPGEPLDVNDSFLGN